MRVLICIFTIFFAASLGAAQEHSGVARQQSDWSVFRSEADGFSIEMPGTPKVTTRDLGNSNTQKMFSVEVGPETYFASVIQLAPGNGPQNPDEAYFTGLLKAYVDGSGTTLRSSRMTTLAGHPAMEGVSDSDSGTHLIDITAAGDRLYLVVFAGGKGLEGEPKAQHLRDSFKLLAN